MTDDLGRRALRALGGRRFQGMTVARGEAQADRWTLVHMEPGGPDHMWADTDRCAAAFEDEEPLRSAIATGWLVINEAALGALLAVVREAYTGAKSWPEWRRIREVILDYCLGNVTDADLCEALVAAIEAARGGWR